jgi:hypothetical protein
MVVQASPASEQQPLQTAANAVVTTAVIAQIATYLAATLTPVLVYRELIHLLKANSPFQQQAVMNVLQRCEKFPQPTLQAIGAAQREVIKMNTMRRAAYIPTAVQRVTTALESDRARGYTNAAAVKRANAAEDRWFAQHVRADYQRMAAANRIDGLQMQHGNVLGWHAVKDKKTTASCLAADGNNFSAITPPQIGWPGVVHMNCRCYPGEPFKNAEMLP